VGVWGISLGGLTTALFASVASRLACAVPEIPAVSLARERFRGLSEAERLTQEEGGVTLECLDAAWATIDPLRYQPRTAPEGRLILAARSDRICPPDQVEALWEHWDRPPIHWSPGGHMLGMGRREKRERLWSHLRRSLLQTPVETPALSHFRR
jgi:predicted alpha/beta hydrolase family esterase